MDSWHGPKVTLLQLRISDKGTGNQPFRPLRLPQKSGERRDTVCLESFFNLTIVVPNSHFVDSPENLGKME